VTTVNIPRESVEKLETSITADSDPTSLPVSFAFVQGDDRPSAFIAGTWKGTYASGRATTATPTLGAVGSGAEVELGSGAWIAYVKVSASPEAPVRRCGSVNLL